MNSEAIEALQAAQDLLAFLRNNIDPENDDSPISIQAAAGFVDSLCAMLNDAEERVSMALDGLELVVGS